jgi:uncharacterized protein YoxC
MEISNWLLIGAAEVYAVMICFLVFLLFNVKSLKKLISSLKADNKGLAEELEELKEEHTSSGDSAADAPEFLRQLKGQAQITKKHHSKIAGHHDIEASLSDTNSTEAQAVALRHAFLANEIEAFTPDKSSKSPKWSSLYQGFASMIDLLKPTNEDETPDDKALKDGFDDVLQLAKKKGADGEVEAALMQYRDLLANLRSGTATEITSTSDSGHSVDALKESQSAQFNDINQWVDRIRNDPASLTDKTVCDGLMEQLQKQTQYLQESEACVALLEKELENCYAEIENLKHSVKEIAPTQKPSAKVNELVSENQRMKQQIEQQSSEIDQLLAQMHMSE